MRFVFAAAATHEEENAQTREKKSPSLRPLFFENLRPLAKIIHLSSETCSTSRPLKKERALVKNAKKRAVASSVLTSSLEAVAVRASYTDQLYRQSRSQLYDTVQPAVQPNALIVKLTVKHRASCASVYDSHCFTNLSSVGLSSYFRFSATKGNLQRCRTTPQEIKAMILSHVLSTTCKMKWYAGGASRVP